MFTPWRVTAGVWASLGAIRFRARTPVLAMLALIVAAGAAACGSSGGGQATSQTMHAASHHARAAKSAAARAAATPVALRYRPLYTLPAPLRDPAYSAVGGDRFVMLGGLDAADVSASEIDVADLHGLVHSASLAAPQHDAQAALLGGKVYVFGGGSATELDHILMYDPAGGSESTVGSLSVPQSDVAVAQAGGTAYIVGGFDGTNYLDTIVTWRPGSKPAVVGHLPQGVRYAAVTVAGNALIILGGVTTAGTSDAIYRFDLSTHQLRRIGTLPHPTEHGNAATLGSTVYMIGGRGPSITAQTSAVYAVNPLTGHVRRAGHLPKPVSDAAAVTIGRAIVVAGGQSPTGTLASVGELVPAGA
jgi:N-acetylneuraminic acid mutarotase